MANDNDNIQITDESQIVLYQPNESISLQVKIDASHDTVWLTQQQIADLFGTKRPAITKHLRNIFNSGELDQNSVSSILEHTAADGKTYKTQFYNLDAIISVGYRVNSINATAFRRWATRVLNNYLLKGYSVNQQLLAMQRQFDSRLEEHDRLFPDAHIDIRKWGKESHDRWLVIDDTLYHCGHSLNANGGHKISAITRMGISPEDILSVVG